MARDIHIKLASVGLNEQGTPWNDGGHQKIEKIVIGYTPSFISSIEAVYSVGDDDTRVLAPWHGASSSSLIKMEKDIPIKLGPCGFKECGQAWDDGAHQKIEKIVISYTDYFINSIQAVYRDGDNNLVLAPQHGANEGSFRTITVTNPIMRIEGCTGYQSGPGISFLQLFSNIVSYGSFGRNLVQGASGNFKFESDVGITGFHGTCHSGRLHSLGVYISSSAKKHLANSSK